MSADYDPSAKELPAFLPSAQPSNRGLRLVFSLDTGIDVLPDPVPDAPAFEPEIAREFEVLAQQWHKETRYWSSVSRMAMHPAYQRIIALGEEVVPYILNDLRRTGGHWLWALYVLSKFQDPAPDNATFDEAVDAWLKWGTERYGAF